MKKIKRCGFALVEVIIVSVVIMGICAFLFANYLPLVGTYEKMESYDTVESKYAVYYIKKMILSEIMNDSSKLDLLTNYSSGTYSYYNGVDLCDYLNDKIYCYKLLSSDYLDVKSIIITHYRLSDVDDKSYGIKDDDDINKLDKSLKSYILYLPTYEKYTGNYDNYNRLIVSFNNGTFAQIEVNYDYE